MRTLAAISLLICTTALAIGADATKPAAAAGIAVIQPTEGNHISGTVRFTPEGDKVHVVGDLEGLTPGAHGFHIHEFGDATAKDGASAGGHYNPGGAPHAGHDAKARHAGDLGNIEAGADGKAHVDVSVDGFSIDGTNAIVGRSVVVHAKADDLTSQPAGNSGPRIGVGVIGLAK